MKEALAAETALREEARSKQKSDGLPVYAPAGVLLERGIESYAVAKRAEAESSKVAEESSKRSTFRLFRKAVKTESDILDEPVVKPPANAALPAITPDVLMKAVPGKAVPPPPTKPEWPKPIDFRVAQLGTGIDFVMEVRSPFTVYCTLLDFCGNSMRKLDKRFCKR